MADAEKYMKGRLKLVPNKFREPGNTDEEMRKMQTKQKRSEKKELKSQKAQAHTMNMDYLLDEVKLQMPSVSSVSQTGNNISNAEDDEISEEEVCIHTFVYVL